MDRIKIEDSRFLIKYACEDLRSLRSVMQSLDSQDLLAVITRALHPIIEDIQKAVDMIGEELQEKKSDSDKQ